MSKTPHIIELSITRDKAMLYIALANSKTIASITGPTEKRTQLCLIEPSDYDEIDFKRATFRKRITFLNVVNVSILIDV